MSAIQLTSAVLAVTSLILSIAAAILTHRRRRAAKEEKETMYRLTLSMAELATIRDALRREAAENRWRAEMLEGRLEGGEDDAELHDLIESYRRDAEGAKLLTDTIFARAELAGTEEAKRNDA